MAHITRWGQDFEVAEKFGYYELITFARVAKGSDANMDELDQILAIDNVLQACFADGVYPEFEKVARENRAGIEELMDTMKEAIEVIGERPTSQPSDSLDGQTPTPLNSGDGSSSRVMQRLDGRPDLQLAVVQAQEARARAI